MLKKSYAILFIIFMFLLNYILFVPKEHYVKVLKIESPQKFILENGIYEIEDLVCFDSSFSERNKFLAQKLGITEYEAFVLGNVAKYKITDIFEGREIYINNQNHLMYNKLDYNFRLELMGYCTRNSKPTSEVGFNYQINKIRKGNYKVIDLDTEKVYKANDKYVRTIKNFMVIRNSHLPQHLNSKRKYKHFNNNSNSPNFNVKSAKNLFEKNSNIKLYLTDLTTNLKVHNTCNKFVCKEVLKNINNSKESIDIAIYGYSRIPEIETALKSAQERGVKIRLVHDSDKNGGNIYPATDVIAKLIKNSKNDRYSLNPEYIMHNKFYIFDNKTVIIGSANLSNTDMSEFNSNAILTINSRDLAKIYTKEFEQLYSGKFHSEKIKTHNSKINIDNTEIEAYFSPQDKITHNVILPMIKHAQNYIYIPTFLITDMKIVNELINAQARGVEVKIIIDALNASGKYSKHKILRNAGILVKTENYAGKMHSKSMIIDDKYTLIGSMNFSNSGENKNDENLVVIKDSEITKFYKTFFQYQWDKIPNKWLRFDPRSEGKDSIGSCSDGLDNNYDGFIDSEDAACK